MSFNPEEFLQQTTTDTFETRMTPIPEGDYLSQVDKFAMRVVEGNVILDVTWAILDEGVKQLLGMDKPTVRQSIFLDIDQNGKLAAGQNKNIQLGKVRDALGQNTPGEPWGINRIAAGLAKIKVGHRPDKSDPSIIYNDVKGVTKAG